MPRYLLCFLFLFASYLNGQTEALLEEALSATVERQSEIALELQKYPLASFSTGAPLKMGRLVTRNTVGGRKDYILLLGFLGSESTLLSLKGVPELSPFSQAINLALVRAGNAEKQENLLKNINRYSVNDDFVYTVVPLLTYTRHREIIDFLWQQVSAENRSCKPADAETKGRIDCAFRIVEYLAPIIEGFPVRYDDEGDLLTTDYPKALAEIRRWYAVHSQDYRIITSTF